MSAWDPLLARLSHTFAGERREQETEFLPAALELVETPPSPIGRAMTFTIVLFLIVALVWATVGRVDIIATASGSVLPTGMTKIVQAADSGIVSAINVQDGDRVRKGDLLVRLDPTAIAADQASATQDLWRAGLDVARLRVLAAGRGGDADDLAIPAGAPADAVADAKAALRAQREEKAARLDDLDEQVREKGAELAGVRGEIDQLNAVLPILRQKDEIHQQLHRKGFSTTFAFLDSQQDLTASSHQLVILKQKARQAEAERDALIRQRDTVRSGFTVKTMSDLAIAEQRRDHLSQEVIKARQRSSQTEIRAPIDGVVEQLALHTIGGVVTPAQRILTVVPIDNRLMVEALLLNRDVGFVHAGQSAEVKIDAFNFTKYGLLPGSVVEIAHDAVDSAGQEPAAARADGQGGPPIAGQARNYVVRIALPRSTMLIDGAPEQLRPGMAVTVEIKTGRRTIIDYLLSPLARRSSESLHER